MSTDEGRDSTRDIATGVIIFTATNFWVASSYFFAYVTLITPNGLEKNGTSMLEVLSSFFTITFFIGIPVLTIIWFIDQRGK